MVRARCLVVVLVATAVLSGALGGCGHDEAAFLTALKLSGSDHATAIRPSVIFCGNMVKPVRGAGNCSAKAPAGKALERVEIRGTVVPGENGGLFLDPSVSGGAAEEFAFSVLLDWGWKPDISSVRPINTLREINSSITPHNVIRFGTATKASDSGHPPAAPLDSNGAGFGMSGARVWGGPGVAVLHVEVDGWNPKGRLCPSAVIGHLCLRPGPSPPADWVPAPGNSSDHNGEVRWPFDPQSPPSAFPGHLAVGDYVRLVGTLWEDEPHPQVDPSKPVTDQETGQNCWIGRHRINAFGIPGFVPDIGGSSTHGRGWFEIHPVDFLARLAATPPTHDDSLELITVCNPATVERDIAPAGPKPGPGFEVGCEENIDHDFTVMASIAAKQIDRRGDHIHVHVVVHDSINFGAKFKAAYRVFWQPTQAGPSTTGCTQV